VYSTKKDSRQAGMTDHKEHGLLVLSGLACPRLSRIDRILSSPCHSGLSRILSFWLVVISNRSFSQWGDMFGDNVIASAILDRLLHHSFVVQINGKSYRIKDKLTEKDG